MKAFIIIGVVWTLGNLIIIAFFSGASSEDQPRPKEK
jgi:hypothetical protein